MFMLKKIPQKIGSFFKKSNDNEKGAIEFLFLVLIFLIIAVVIAVGVVMSSYFKGV